MKSIIKTHVIYVKPRKQFKIIYNQNKLCDYNGLRFTVKGTVSECEEYSFYLQNYFLNKVDGQLVGAHPESSLGFNLIFLESRIQIHFPDFAKLKMTPRLKYQGGIHRYFLPCEFSKDSFIVFSWRTFWDLINHKVASNSTIIVTMWLNHVNGLCCM